MTLPAHSSQHAFHLQVSAQLRSAVSTPLSVAGPMSPHCEQVPTGPLPLRLQACAILIRGDTPGQQACGVLVLLFGPVLFTAWCAYQLHKLVYQRRRLFFVVDYEHAQDSTADRSLCTCGVQTACAAWCWVKTTSPVLHVTRPGVV